MKDRMLQSILESSTETSIISTDLEGNILYWNKGAEKILGYAPGEVVGRKIDFIYRKEDLESGKIARIRELVREGGTFHGELEEIRKDSKAVLVSLTVTPQRNIRGEIIGLLGMGQDVTERAELQRKILNAKRELQSMFDAITDIIFVRDRDFRVLRANNPAFDLFGGREILGKECTALRGNLYRRGDCPSDDQIAERRAQPYEICDEESGRIFLVHHYPIFDEKDRMSSVIVSLRDITESKEMERKQRELELELIQQSKLSSIGMLASGVAHNINNPLTSILGRAQLLHRAHPDLKEVDTIIAQGKRISAIIDNMMYKSRQEQTPERQLLDLNHLLIQELSFLEADLDFKHKVEKEYDFADSLPQIEGVYSDFSQSLLNIIRNALDAMYASKRKKLTVRTWSDEEFIYIEIGDTGCGISEENLSKIFDPFFTTKPLAGRQKEGEPSGTGLGLSSCYQLLRPYGAVISAKSELGEGTTFTVRIPTREA